MSVQDETPPSDETCPREASMSEVRDGSPTPPPRVMTRGTDKGRDSLSNGGLRVSTEEHPTINPIQRRAQTVAAGGSFSESTTNPLQRAFTMQDLGGRRRIARTLLRLSDSLGSATPNQFDDSSFKRGPALDYPTLPGEEQRNDKLPGIMNRYNPGRDADGNATPRTRSHSRAPSFSGSMNSGLGINLDGSPSPRTHSPRRPTFPTERTSGENVLSRTTSGPNRDRPRRRATLEVLTSHYNPIRTQSGSSITFNNSVSRGHIERYSINNGPNSPAIVISPDPQESDNEFAVE
jgi:hypothetical protein